MGRCVNFSSDVPAVSASVSCMDIGHFDDSIDEVNASQKDESAAHRGTPCGGGTRALY